MRQIRRLARSERDLLPTAESGRTAAETIARLMRI